MTAPLPPSPKGEFLLGNLRAFSRDTLSFLLESRQYGDIVMMRFGPFPAFILNHPDYLHQVLVTDADKFYKSQVTKQVLGAIVGNGLFLSDGAFWKRQRKLVGPAFHTRRVGAYAQVMTDYAESMMARWGDGAALDVDREMTNVTMNIVAKTLFDADVSGAASEVGEAVTTALEIVNVRFNRLVNLPDWLPTRENREMKAAVARLDAIIMGFIDERRRGMQDKGDLLSMLLMAQDEDDGGSMTDQQVRDEAMTLFGAGHETTANALTWTWYCLSQHPQVEARLHEELARVLGGRTPTISDLPRLQYTEMVIKEAMRLYPPAWGTTREAIADVELGDYTLRKGGVAFLNFWGVHRDARFFPNPDRFDPERFNPENEKQIPKYAFLPFGAGPRVCIGSAFAMMEARLIVATVAQHFRFELAPGHPVQPERVFTLRPKYGMRMIARRREQS